MTGLNIFVLIVSKCSLIRAQTRYHKTGADNERPFDMPEKFTAP